MGFGTENRLGEAVAPLLQTIIELQRELHNARDEAYELRRDGQLAIDGLSAEVDRKRIEVAYWRARHRSISNFSVCAVLMSTALLIALLWRLA